MSQQATDNTATADLHQLDGLTETVAESIEGVPQLIATYDEEKFKIHHSNNGYEEDAALTSYFQLDFFEHEMMLDSMFPGSTQVKSRTLTFDDRQLVMVYDTDVAVLTIVAGDERIEPVQDALLSFKNE
ncbi:hypothetical protein [Halodesulfurarchaeum sp.]|uniref:hypothetical protein n=1 Tax=Halodesulfurarchaeum sp. TaxID=1980530 RepID=UPI002FC32B40